MGSHGVNTDTRSLREGGRGACVKGRGPASLLAEIEDTRVRSSAVHRDSIAVRREGAAQIALVGRPNVGKSSIVQALSDTQIKTGDHASSCAAPCQFEMRTNVRSCVTLRALRVR